MTVRLENSNPIVYEVESHNTAIAYNYDDDIKDEFTQSEIFGIIRNINDPEHPLTLEQLNVVQINHVFIDNQKKCVRIEFTPTIPHCSMATLIGLSVKVHLLRCLPITYKVDVVIREGTHQSERAINKQLADKERVAAAIENDSLIGVVNQCIARTLKE